LYFRNTADSSKAIRIMTKARATQLFFVVLILWVTIAVAAAFISGRWFALTSVPAALLLVAAARAERLSQSAQLAWPVVMVPGATFVFVGFMQALGYGRMDNEPLATYPAIRVAFFAVGFLLHLAAFALLASEPRASNHPSGEIADRMP
jgi:hypothetical protein